MTPTEMPLFVSSFLINQALPTISVIKNAGGVLTVEPPDPSPAYNSTTSQTTATFSATETQLHAVIAFKDESLPAQLRGTVHPKEVATTATDPDGLMSDMDDS